MYAALTYFGQGKLVCTSTTTADNGKTVTVTDGKKTWTGVMTNGTCVFTLPTKQKYTIKLLNGNVVEYETETIFGFGEYKEVEVGMDKTSWKGLKAILNAGLETEMITVGDQISATIGGKEELFDIVHIDYRPSLYGRNLILAKHTLLEEHKPLRTDIANYGGYGSTLVATFLDDSYYNSLPNEMKSVITKMKYTAMLGGAAANTVEEEHYLWLPMEANLYPQNTYGNVSEKTVCGAEQFSYFATDASRIKNVANTNVKAEWWIGTPRGGVNESFLFIAVNGGQSYAQSHKTGFYICPFFMIAADTE